MRYYVYHFMSGLYFHHWGWNGPKEDKTYPVYIKAGAYGFSSFEPALYVVEQLKEYGHHCVIEGVEE